jgi:RNA polymerase sigma-70 factor (ECF subfamily)
LSLSGTDASHAPDNNIPDEPAVVALVDRAVATRDQVAFGALYDRFLDRVYRYLYYRTGSQVEAEDLTEQVFLKAWEAIDRFRWQGRPFQAWLYRLAHNVHIDHLRSKRQTISLNDEERPIELASEAATAELAQRLDADLLARAVRQLTPEQQQVIILRFMDGFENAQIAQLMNKREGAIRALQLRALLSLRRILDGQVERGEP